MKTAPFYLGVSFSLVCGAGLILPSSTVFADLTLDPLPCMNHPPPLEDILNSDHFAPVQSTCFNSRADSLPQGLAERLGPLGRCPQEGVIQPLTNAHPPAGVFVGYVEANGFFQHDNSGYILRLANIIHRQVPRPRLNVFLPRGMGPEDLGGIAARTQSALA